jgi:hypothetical protein
MLAALMRERNWYSKHLSQILTTVIQSFCRDAVTKTNTVSDLIQSLDAQGVTSHLTFLFSAFFTPSVNSAPVNSFEKKKKGGADKKKEVAEVQEQFAVMSSTAQVPMMTAIMMMLNVIFICSKSGP